MPRNGTAAAIEAPEESMAILIVDDDPVQCRLLEGMVQKFGYEMLTRGQRRRRGWRCSTARTARASTA